MFYFIYNVHFLSVSSILVKKRFKLQEIDSIYSHGF